MCSRHARLAGRGLRQRLPDLRRQLEHLPLPERRADHDPVEDDARQPLDERRRPIRVAEPVLVVEHLRGLDRSPHLVLVEEREGQVEERGIGRIHVL